jgi:hypothetical protein
VQVQARRDLGRTSEPVTTGGEYRQSFGTRRRSDGYRDSDDERRWHTRALAARRQWVCNEKRLLECAGLGSLHAQFAQVPQDLSRLSGWLETVAERLEPLER